LNGRGDVYLVKTFKIGLVDRPWTHDTHQWLLLEF